MQTSMGELRGGALAGDFRLEHVAAAVGGGTTALTAKAAEEPFALDPLPKWDM